MRKGPTAAQSAQSNQPENAAPVSSVKEEDASCQSHVGFRDFCVLWDAFSVVLVSSFLLKGTPKGTPPPHLFFWFSKGTPKGTPPFWHLCWLRGCPLLAQVVMAQKVAGDGSKPTATAGSGKGGLGFRQASFSLRAAFVAFGVREAIAHPGQNSIAAVMLTPDE